jgi:hypothetical protein
MLAVLAATAASIILLYVAVTWPGKSDRVFRRRFDNRVRSPLKGFDPDLHVEQQLLAVMRGSFEKRRLLNLGEYRAFKIIEDYITRSRRGYRVFAQTSLGEILASPDELAFRSINSKRIDILIVDQGGWPVIAVEFQGGGHYQGTATIRDAVKKEALSKAGVAYVEVFPSDAPDDIRLRIRKQLGWTPRVLSAQEVGHA